MILRDEGNAFEANTIIESKNTEFFKFIFPEKTTIENPLPINKSTDNIHVGFEIEHRKSKRMRKTTNFGDDFYVFLTENDPQTFTEMMTSRDAPMWREAVNSELDSIISNHVW